jgi:hypothetical protein
MSLGLHLLNDSAADPEREKQAVECFERGIACEEAGYLPFRELAMYHLRKATLWFNQAMKRSPGMPWHRANLEFYNMLAKNVPPVPLMGSARRGVPVCPPIELPHFELAEEIRQAMGALELNGGVMSAPAPLQLGASGDASASPEASPEPSGSSAPDETSPEVPPAL